MTEAKSLDVDQHPEHVKSFLRHSTLVDMLGKPSPVAKSSVVSTSRRGKKYS